jgi:hypothetical protein
MNYSETIEIGNDLMKWSNDHSVEIITLLAFVLIIISLLKKMKVI